MIQTTTPDKHSLGYGMYVLIWLILLSLTVTTVAAAGINFASLTLFIALLIAAVKSSLVINYYMHIKFEDKIFKFFIVITVMTLLAVFVLTTFDLFYR